MSALPRIDGRVPLISRAWRDERGATAVEFGIIALPFVALLVASLQLGVCYLAQSALEVATEKASRIVLIGTAQTSGMTQSQFQSAVCGKLPSILRCSNVMVDAQVYTSFASSNTSAPTVTYNPSGTVSNQWNYNLGGANDIVVLRVMYLLPVIGVPLGLNLANTSYGRRLLMATAVFKNEPYQ